MLEIVNLEQAKKLYELNYVVPANAFYLDGELNLPKHTTGNYNDPVWVSSWRRSPTHDTISAPTHAAVVDWFRHLYQYWIAVDYSRKRKWRFEVTDIIDGTCVPIDLDSTDDFVSPEDAYSAAISATLRTLHIFNTKNA